MLENSAPFGNKNIVTTAEKTHFPEKGTLEEVLIELDELEQLKTRRREGVIDPSNDVDTLENENS